MTGQAARYRARSSDLVVEPLGDEVLIYDLSRDRAHCLNPTAARIWELSDGSRDATAIAAGAESRLGRAVDPAIVDLAWRQLRRAHLLEPDPAAPRARGDGTTLNRREMARRLGLAGVAALLPLVSSIVAPTPAAAASCVTSAKCKSKSGNPCGLPCCAPTGGTCVCTTTAKCKNLKVGTTGGGGGRRSGGAYHSESDGRGSR